MLGEDDGARPRMHHARPSLLTPLKYPTQAKRGLEWATRGVMLPFGNELLWLPRT